MIDGMITDPPNNDRKASLGLALRQRILTMELAPGAVLDEVALSEEFGLSRPPVRELMRQMAGEGYIELEANRAARVSSMSWSRLSTRPGRCVKAASRRNSALDRAMPTSSPVMTWPPPSRSPRSSRHCLPSPPSPRNRRRLR